MATIGTGRQARREALARWAPWGPRAPQSLVERRHGPRLALDYLLRLGVGTDVVSEDGTRLGTVERLVVPTFGFWPAALVVRADDGGRERIRGARVVRAHPRDGRVVVAAEPEPRRDPWTSGTRRPPRPRRRPE